MQPRIDVLVIRFWPRRQLLPSLLLLLLLLPGQAPSADSTARSRRCALLARDLFLPARGFVCPCLRRLRVYVVHPACATS
jgi:hypothetical protein